MTLYILYVGLYENILYLYNFSDSISVVILLFLLFIPFYCIVGLR